MAVASYCFDDSYYMLWICEVYGRNPVENWEISFKLYHKAKYRINYSEPLLVMKFVTVVNGRVGYRHMAYICMFSVGSFYLL